MNIAVQPTFQRSSAITHSRDDSNEISKHQAINKKKMPTESKMILTMFQSNSIQGANDPNKH